ncbi:spore coat protein T-like [Calliphora vicina]|uniref:spore coat protein T-like n=1 Tax=Calliphora vicina TaxID=7373 RepID=UPI00325AE15A
MRLLSYLTILAVILAFALAEEEIVEKSEESTNVAVEPLALIDLDANVKDDGDSERKTRQFRTFGFGRPYYGGGFYRPRPYYGGGFYRPRPYYGGGFYRPRPYYGGGFYGPRPYYGGGYGGFYG